MRNFAGYSVALHYLSKVINEVSFSLIFPIKILNLMYKYFICFRCVQVTDRIITTKQQAPFWRGRRENLDAMEYAFGIDTMSNALEYQDLARTKDRIVGFLLSPAGNVKSILIILVS